MSNGKRPALQCAGRRLPPKANRLCSFFGVPESEINPICRAIRDLAAPPPDWLRPCRSFQDLPRVAVLDARIPAFDLRHLPIPVLAEHVFWIVTATTGAWSFGADGFRFENETDALRYRFARHAPSVKAAMMAQTANDPAPSARPAPSPLVLRPRRHLTLAK